MAIPRKVINPRRTLPKERLSVERIVDATLRLMADNGYDAVSMRALAKELNTGPASLYAHVASRFELDQLVLARIVEGVHIPPPDPKRWDEQLKQVLRDTLAVYRKHPGSARASMAMVPMQESTLDAAEGMMRIMLAGGVAEQFAAWFLDVGSLFVGAIAVEEYIWASRGDAGGFADHQEVDEELSRHFRDLPQERFPLLSSLAGVLTAGSPEDRFEFGLEMMISGLRAMSAAARRKR